MQAGMRLLYIPVNTFASVKLSAAKRLTFSAESSWGFLSSPLQSFLWKGEILFKMSPPFLLHTCASMEKGWGGEERGGDWKADPLKQLSGPLGISGTQGGNHSNLIYWEQECRRVGRNVSSFVNFLQLPYLLLFCTQFSIKELRTACLSSAFFFSRLL